MRKRKVLALIVALCMVLSVATAGHAVLKAVGPTSSPVPPGDGFPLWYQDTTNLVLDLCLPDPGAERAGGYCLTLPADFPAPNDPVVFPTNYAAEGFWWSAGAIVGPAQLVLALEAAFSSGEIPINGDQVAFGRVRVRIDATVAGTYTVTYPYGVLTFDLTADDVAGARAINFTSDIGIGAPLDFTGALQSAVGPFLVAADCVTGAQQPFFADVAIPGKQYLANPALPTCVIGGTQFHTVNTQVNTFRIVGPANAFGQGVNTIETDQFNITGRRFLGTPIVIDRATYTRTAAGAVAVDVFGTAGLAATSATATSGASVNVPMQGVPPVPGNKLFAHLELGNVPVPASASITATAADPFVALLPPGAPTNLLPTTVSAGSLQDLVTITTAQYNLATNQLTILAASSDQDPVNGPTLTEQFLQSLQPPVALNNGIITVVNGVTVPPAEVVVNSTAGGASTKPVEIINVTATGVLGYYKDGAWVLDLNGNNVTEATDASYTFGFPGAIPVVGDWTGSGRLRIGAYSNGTWYLDTNGNGKWDGATVDTQYTFGFAGATPVVGDWAGTGSTRIGVYQNGTWYIDFDGNGAWDNEVNDRKYTFGFAGAVPVVGKWNGAAASRIGVYSAASWYLDVDGDGVWDGGVTDVLRNFGFAGATPVVGDWTRSGQERIGVYSAGSWYLDLGNNGVWDGDATDRLVNGFGGTGFMPVTGNW